jgi:hypothetical protein
MRLRLVKSYGEELMLDITTGEEYLLIRKVIKGTIA